MTKVLTEEVNAFKVRTLNDKYVAIFMIPSVFQMIYHSKNNMRDVQEYHL